MAREASFPFARYSTTPLERFIAARSPPLKADIERAFRTLARDIGKRVWRQLRKERQHARTQSTQKLAKSEVTTHLAQRYHVAIEDYTFGALHLTDVIAAIGRDLDSLCAASALAADALHGYFLNTIVLYAGDEISTGCFAGGMADYEQDQCRLYIAAGRLLEDTDHTLHVGDGSHNVCKDFRSILAHEIGHLVMPKFEDQIREKFRIIYDSMPVEYWIEHVSTYAGKDDQELFAESFAAWTHPDYQPGMLPTIIEEVMLGTDMMKFEWPKLAKAGTSYEDQDPNNSAEYNDNNDQGDVTVTTSDGFEFTSDMIERIIDVVKDAEWFVLSGTISPVLRQAFADAGYSELAAAGVGTDTKMYSVPHEGAEKYAADHGAELVSQISDTTRKKLRNTVLDAVKEGWGNEELQTEIENNFAFGSVRADLIARNELSLAYSRGRVESAKAAGAHSKQWLLSFDHDPKEDCSCSEAADAGVIPYDESFVDGDDDYMFAPGHVNACFAGTTFASYGDTHQLVRSTYSGPAVSLELELLYENVESSSGNTGCSDDSGACIAGTEHFFKKTDLLGSDESRPTMPIVAQRVVFTIGPNHPMLTRRGFVKAAKLLESDQLLYDIRCDSRISASGVFQSDLEKIPMFENAFETLALSGVTQRPTAAHYFHGDEEFIYGDIDVVRPTRRLLPVLDPLGIEQFGKCPLMGTDVSAAHVSSCSACHLSLDRVFLAATCRISGSGEGFSILDRGSGVSPFLAFRVVSVRHTSFVGYAFDASTEFAIYNNQGFVVKNCWCDWRGFYGDDDGSDDDSDDDAEKMSKFDAALSERLSKEYSDDEPRDDHGKWTTGAQSGAYKQKKDEYTGPYPVDDKGEGLGYDSPEGIAFRQREADWKASTKMALTEGDITEDEARTKGFYADGGGKYGELPSTLYHVTTAANAIQTEGIKTRDEHGANAGIGGGTSDTISLTSDLKTAEDYHAGLLEAHDLMNGKITVAGMMQDAKEGKLTNGKDFSDKVTDLYAREGKQLDGMPQGLYDAINGTKTWYVGKYALAPENASRREMLLQMSGNGEANQGTKIVDGEFLQRPATQEEQTRQKAEFLQRYQFMRESAGGPAAPAFFTNDWDAFKAKPQSDIRLLQFDTKPGSQGYYLPGEHEWRVHSGHVLRLNSVLKIERITLAKRWLDVPDPADYPMNVLSDEEMSDNLEAQEMANACTPLAQEDDAPGQRITGSAVMATNQATTNYYDANTRAADHQRAYEIHSVAANHYRHDADNDSAADAHERAAAMHLQMKDQLLGNVVKYSPDQPRSGDGKWEMGDGVTKHGEMFGSNNDIQREIYTHEDAPHDGLRILRYPDGRRFVQTIELPLKLRGKGIAKKLYQAALKDGDLEIVPHSEDAQHVHDSLIRSGAAHIREENGKRYLSAGSKKFVKYSPDQPREPNGEFGSGGNSIPLTEDGKKQAQENYDRQRNAIALRGEAVARNLDFPVDKISYNSNPPPTFQLNGRTIEYAGAANLKTGEITIYTRNTPDEKEMDYVMSHEIGHQMYQSVVDEFHAELERAADHERIERTDAEGNVRMMPLMRPDGSMREDGVNPELLTQLKASFPVWSIVGKVDNASTSQELQEKDGVSDYSRKWWQAAVNGTATRHQAMHETMAEITRIVYESKRDTGKMWGSEEAKQVKPVWRKYFTVYNKAFKAMKNKS